MNIIRSYDSTACCTTPNVSFSKYVFSITGSAIIHSLLQTVGHRYRIYAVVTQTDWIQLDKIFVYLVHLDAEFR